MAKKGTLFGKPRSEVVKHPGAFSAQAAKAGKSTAAYATQVLKEGSKASTLTKRRANLAKTFAKLRAGKSKFLVPLLLIYTLGSATAATKSCPSGQLGGLLNATGPTTDVIIARAAPALVVQASEPGAGTATVAVEMSCDGTNWAPVGSPMSLATTTPAAFVSVQNPTCTFRANVTACSSCAVTVVFSCAGA
jgi:hypothetical protein